jgi:hypothetical protein
VDCPAPGNPYYGQDGSVFVNVPHYELDTVDGDEILIDHTTGLTWLRHPAPELLTWSEAIDHADELEAAGYDDWRLPHKRELVGILSFGHTEPTLALPEEVEETNRPPTPESHCAWTLTNLKFPSLHAKAVCLDDNHGTLSNKYEKKYVYVVRGLSINQEFPGRFLANQDGTITDQATGLMWQQNEVLPRNWEQALAYCEKLELGEHTDWRLPTIKELSSLVDENRINPAVDTTAFPGARAVPYWSSTTFTGHAGFAWYVKFGNGLEYNGGYKGRRYLVRAVRGGTVQSQPPELPAFLQPVEPPAMEEMEPGREPRPEEENNEFLEPYPLDPDDY